MLPYSPLHHLLLADAGAPLVMTSGNVSDEPIAYRDDDALERLGRRSPTASSSTTGRSRRARTTRSCAVRWSLRRSRGRVPGSLAAARAGRAPGARVRGRAQEHVLPRARRARVGRAPHRRPAELGDARVLPRGRSRHFERLFAVAPEVVAHDLHPDYRSTAYALERDAAAHVAVQHHHAHLAACLAEHGETGPAVGAIFDGSGLGTDGTVWGGELLAGGLDGFERAGHLWPVRLPGGDAAVREPWRMACAWLAAAERRAPAGARRGGSTRRAGRRSPRSSAAGRPRR